MVRLIYVVTGKYFDNDLHPDGLILHLVFLKYLLDYYLH